MSEQEPNYTHLITNLQCELILEKVLRMENEIGSLVSYKIKRDLNAAGYWGKYLQLNIRYYKGTERDIKKPLVERRFFIKTLTDQRVDRSEYLLQRKMMRKESKICMQLLNALRTYSSQIWCARCYLAKSDLFVVQNVMDLGYEPVEDVSRSLNRQQMEAVLKGLAVMHASSLAFEDKKKVKVSQIMRECLFEVPFSNNVVWYESSVRAILSVLRQEPLYQSPDFQHYIDYILPTLFRSLFQMVDPSPKYCNVFSHRDIWGGNVFFSKTDPLKCAVFVDFQFCRYSPPAIDFLMTLFLNLTPSERWPVEEEYSQFYYQYFAQELHTMGLNAEEFMTYDNFKKSLIEMALFGALYNCISATFLKSPVKEMKLNCPEDFHAYRDIDRTEEVIQMMNDNEEYRRHLQECLFDLMDISLLKRKFGTRL